MILDWVKNQAGEPRLERKYYLQAQQGWLLKPYIQLASEGLKEIYYQRKINNVYFDTENLAFCNDNLIGAFERLKCRLRWYGEGKIQKPNLEIKMKQGNLVYKLVQPYEEGLPIQLQELIKRLKPTLTNSYYRQYYLTQDKKIRLTIDSQIRFEKYLSPKTVVELKYAPEDESAASRLINSFPLLLQKNSKYVEGIASRWG